MGEQKCLQLCMLASEDEEHFQWAFHQFEKLLNDSPKGYFYRF
jgi:hypothetical protein